MDAKGGHLALAGENKLGEDKIMLDGTADVIDTEAWPLIDMFQTFKLTQDQMVDVTFDKQVDITGFGLTDQWSGLWEDLPEFRLFETTVATPKFHTLAMLHSTTGLDFGPEFGLQLLKRNIIVGAGAVAAFKGGFGPVLETGAEISFGRVALFDSTFALGGFNFNP